MTQATPMEPALAQAAWAQAEAAQPTPKRTEHTVRNVPGPRSCPSRSPSVPVDGKTGPTRRKGPARPDARR